MYVYRYIIDTDKEIYVKYKTCIIHCKFTLLLLTFPIFVIIMKKRKQLEEGAVNFVSELDETVNHVRAFMDISMYIADHTVSAVRH